MPRKERTCLTVLGCGQESITRVLDGPILLRLYLEHEYLTNVFNFIFCETTLFTVHSQIRIPELPK